jgi:hypothetical protein
MSNIVPSADLVTANALDGFTWSVMLAFGALLGGVAAAAFGVTTAFVIDAATFLLSAWFVARIGVTARDAELAGHGAGLRDIVAGLGYLRRRPFVLGLSLAKAGGALIWGGVNVLEIALATQVFPLTGNGTLTLGILYAAVGVGTGLGPLLVRRWVGDERNGLLWGIGGGFLVLSVGVLGLGLAPTLLWATAATLLRSLGSGTLWVFSSAILQRIVDDDFRGRVFAFEFAAMTLTQSLAILVAGVALDQWSFEVQEVLTGAGVFGLLVSAGWLWFQLRSMAQPAASAQETIGETPLASGNP